MSVRHTLPDNLPPAIMKTTQKRDYGNFGRIAFHLDD